MRVKEYSYTGGYRMWLSAADTYNWANRIGSNWPCSQLSGKRLFATVDSNGLCDFTVNGKETSDIGECELLACIADHLPDTLKQFWPCWN